MGMVMLMFCSTKQVCRLKSYVRKYRFLVQHGMPFYVVSSCNHNILLWPFSDTCVCIEYYCCMFRLRWPGLRSWRRRMLRWSWSRHCGRPRGSGAVTMTSGWLWVPLKNTHEWQTRMGATHHCEMREDLNEGSILAMYYTYVRVCHAQECQFTLTCVQRTSWSRAPTRRIPDT